MVAAAALPGAAGPGIRDTTSALLERHGGSLEATFIPNGGRNPVWIREGSMKNLSVVRSCAVIKLSDLGTSSVPLQEQINPIVNSAPFLVLDVDGINFDSMMLGELVNLYTACSQRWGGRPYGVALIRAPEVTKQIVRIAKLAEKLPLYDDLESAWRAFGATPGQARV